MNGESKDEMAAREVKEAAEAFQLALIKARELGLDIYINGVSEKNFRMNISISRKLL